jgi:outer membrane protein assembly factor BamD (BamD/ComL family)
MTKTLTPVILLVLFCVSSAIAQDLKPPTLTPAPGTESQKRLINEGIVLHDRGDYDGAVAKYEEVLKENPDNDWALYEIGYSYQMKKDYRKSLEYAYKGAQYKSERLSQFYVLIGNDLDELGEGKKSVEVYEKGIKLRPDNFLLYYNLAITQSKLKNVEEIRKNLKKALYLNPNHASSHAALAQFFAAMRYKVPALFAAMRFLVIEPESPRTARVYKIFSDTLSGGATAGKNPNEINIFVDMGGKKDEGDFGSLDLILGIVGAANMTEEKKNKSEIERLVDRLDSFFAIVSEGDPKGDKAKFTYRYYIPYFIELKNKKYVEPFAYYISQSTDLKGVPEWLAANQSRVNEFLTWSRNYQWPKESEK